MMKRSEHSAWLRNLFAMIAIIAFFGFGMIPRAARAACVGDCDGGGSVTVNEILTMVNIALGNVPVSECLPGDANNDGQITVDEILTAVNNALNGCPSVQGRCGDHVTNTELGEECDDGGTCIGGNQAGKACTSEDDCGAGQNGVCIGGAAAEVACDPTNANACPGGECVKCVPQGGDGCAANCTNESLVVQDLVPGVVQGSGLKPGTAGSIVYTDGPLGALVLPFQEGTTQTLAVGKPRNGLIPLVVIANSVHYPVIPISSFACACVRGVANKTCGGVLFEADYVTSATDCTPGYTPGTCSGTSPQSCSADTECPTVTLPDKTTLKRCVGGKCTDCHLDSDCSGGGTCVMHACDGKNPCAFVTGPGNGGAGFISCPEGMQGVNLFFSEDSKGSADPVVCDPNLGGPDFVPPSPAFPICGDPPVIALSGTGPAGSSVVLDTTAIGNPSGPCTAQPATFCTDDEPFVTRGLPETLPSVTGIAEGIMYNANQTDADTICNCPPGLTGCDPSECIVDATHPHGGHSSLGAALPSGSNVCSEVFAPSVSGQGTAGAFTSLSNNTTNDIVVTNLLQAK